MTDSRELRRVGFFSATALVAANMIGAGVFTTAGFMAADLKSGFPILAAWGLGGVLALCGALAYGELGAMMPRAGGEYFYLSRVYHPAVGFLSGWVSLFVGFSAPIAAACVAFGRYFSAIRPAMNPMAASLGLLAAVTLLHAVHVGWGCRIQNLFTVFKAMLILFLAGAGLVLAPEGWTVLLPKEGDGSALRSGAFAVTLIFVSFAYSGWNAAAYLGGEVRDPGRNLPRSLFTGTLTVCILYLLLNAAFLLAVPLQEMAGVVEVGHLASRRLLGDGAGRLLSGGIALALVSSASAMVMAGPRVYLAMAEDGLFAAPLSRRTRAGAPVYAVLFQALIAGIMIVTSTFEDLLIYIGFTLSLFAGLAVAAVYVARFRMKDRPRPYRTFGFPVTPLIFLAFTGWILVHTLKEKPVVCLLWGGGTLAVGLGAYLLFRRRRGIPEKK